MMISSEGESVWSTHRVLLLHSFPRRSISGYWTGPVGSEVKAALYDSKSDIPAVNYFYGIGGRDYTVESALSVYDDLMNIVDGKMEPEQFKYIGLRK